MPRYRITVEYDGTDLVGWQKQANGLSVQEALENALAAFTGEAPEVYGSGRTDAGVHALGQVAHFDLGRVWTSHTLVRALNVHLRPAAIAVLDAQPVADDFHARFSAVRRHYRYRILNRHPPPILDRNRVWHVFRPLDVGVMHAAAQHLVGYHDFSSFRSAECQAKSPMKTLERFQVTRVEDEVVLEVSARSFLHNQVRAMVGTLKMVGEGKWSIADLVKARDAHNRSAAGPTAAACGLYFVGVEY